MRTPSFDVSQELDLAAHHLRRALARCWPRPSPASAAGEQWIDGNTQYSDGIELRRPARPATYNESRSAATPATGARPTRPTPRSATATGATSTTLPVGPGLRPRPPRTCRSEIALPAGHAAGASTRTRRTRPTRSAAWRTSMQRPDRPTSTNGKLDAPGQLRSITGKYCQSDRSPRRAPNGTILSYALLAQGQALAHRLPAALHQEAERHRRAEQRLPDDRDAVGEPGITSRRAALPVELRRRPPRRGRAARRSAARRPARSPTPPRTRKNFMCNWYRVGQGAMSRWARAPSGAFVPQASSQQYNVEGQLPGLLRRPGLEQPDARYRRTTWRLKFVDDQGHAPHSPGRPRRTTARRRRSRRPARRPTEPAGHNPGSRQRRHRWHQRRHGRRRARSRRRHRRRDRRRAAVAQTPDGQTGGQTQERSAAAADQQKQEDQQPPTRHHRPDGRPRRSARPSLATILKKGLRRQRASCNEGCPVDGEAPDRREDREEAEARQEGRRRSARAQAEAARRRQASTVPVKLTAKAKKALKKANRRSRRRSLIDRDRRGGQRLRAGQEGRVTLKR